MGHDSASFSTTQKSVRNNAAPHKSFYRSSETPASAFRTAAKISCFFPEAHPKPGPLQYHRMTKSMKPVAGRKIAAGRPGKNVSHRNLPD
jgi:hypothetical protein